MEYLIALFSQSLPMSVFGLVGAFFFRKSTQLAIFAGVVGSMSLPIISLVMGLTSRPDFILASALLGILFGWGVAHVSK